MKHDTMLIGKYVQSFVGMLPPQFSSRISYFWIHTEASCVRRNGLAVPQREICISNSNIPEIFVI